MSERCDAIVIGSGHNGLTCACYLAKAGMKVLVLEQYASIGGMTNTEELTLPGFHSDTHAIGYQLANLSPVPRELGLHRYGFELLHPEIGFSQVFPDGTAISVFRDIERTCESIARFSARDADAWRALCARFAAAADQIAAAIHSPPPSPAEQLLALEASPDGLDEYRFQLQSFRSWARETFEAEQTRLLLGTWCNHVGLAPDDAGGAGIAWSFSGLIQQYGNNLVKGGMRHLPLALAGFLGAHGGEIRTHAKVDKIQVEHGRAVAVRLADGDVIDVGQLVTSNIDPQQLALKLLGDEVVGSKIAGKMRRYELGESVLVIYLALDRPVDLEILLPSTPRGTITHGAFLPYQVGAMRPIPEMGQYRSPVGNVYLCGSGSHPGAGVSMAPGRNAAQAIYRDLSLAFDPIDGP